MKKTVKKITAVGLTLTSVMGLVACGSSAKNDSTSKEVTKPDQFTVMVDGTIIKETNNGQAYYDYYKSLTGLDIKWMRPDHAGYYDAVANAFNSQDTLPDVVLLSQDYYTLYAANGYLWDMTDAWEKSATKNSGRLIPAADQIFDGLKANGPDGEQALYGFAAVRGNGCVTYVKEAWLKDAGLSKADYENKQITFAQYYEMLKKMKAAKPTLSVISSAGFVADETPYTNYLPEFYQQAQYTFYKDSTGAYVDGFSQQAMKDALTRIGTAVADGILDKESVNNSTTNARDKFYQDKTGVFTYWAGTWAETIRQNLQSRGFNDSLIQLKPVKELGAYLERIAPCWAITTHATNPEGIFKYFIDTFLDGGDIQTAWTYGAKGVHWDTKAESVTVKGQTTPASVFKDGEFHFLPSTETPTSLQNKNHIDSTLSLASFINGDPGASQLVPLVKTSEDAFAENSVTLKPLPMTSALGDNIGTINKARKLAVAAVATGAKTADQAIADYNSQVGSLVSEVLKSLNQKK